MPPNGSDPPIAKPTIFLRNKFHIKPGLHARFFAGKREFLTFTKHVSNPKLNLRLVAACGQEPVIRDTPTPVPLPPMMQIWSLPDWGSLYEGMYEFSEMDWYNKEVQSLQSEYQDLLVGAGQGIETSPRPQHWDDKWTPSYVYLYEEFQLNPVTTKLQHLRELNWLLEQVKELGCYLQWIGGGITGIPAQISVLWRARSVSVIKDAHRTMAYEPQFAERYANMMLGVRNLTQTFMYPESTEYIDNEET